ncbi:YeeE/YedE family protein [Clostridiisalibacter paucivorans]|uniref:YeeE/YedE family protein n=1 Tax=Clostridiisalibacter paucivorans TaxID=408753 RepID=UPI00047AB7B5|nr:YeeE/YedE family protein [Clostridiisalibacter paucivorans]
MNKLENILGFIGILLVLIFGKMFLKTDMLFFRLLVGLGLGYTLTRAYTGFAGSVNRAYNTGSTKLARTMMFMFFITALLNAAFLFKGDPSSYGLWINPINLGLMLGALLFGFGMSFSACCASGVLTDLATGFPRAFVTLIFFGLGIFIGFPIQRTSSLVRRSWFTTEVGQKTAGGVYLPDLFKWDGFEGYIGAMITIALLASLVAFVACRYEKYRRRKNTYIGHPMEEIQESKDYVLGIVDSSSLATSQGACADEDHAFFSTANYNRLFIKPWTLKQGAMAMSIIFVLLMGITKAGWGASTPYGIWFGKFLMMFGVSADSLASFTKMSSSVFELPFFEHPITVQNVGILIGTIFYLLTAGKLKKEFMSEMHITVKEVFLFALGGITMGLGTRLANGCNVGALYTPIANFSLSGWIFLIFMVIGGIIGNTFAKKASS